MRYLQPFALVLCGCSQLAAGLGERRLQKTACADDPEIPCAAMVLAAHAGNLDCDDTVASIFPPGAPPPVELEKIVDENKETTLQSVCCSSCSLRVSPADDSIVCTTAQLKAGGPCCGDGWSSCCDERGARPHAATSRG